ncbi:MAG TPA: RNA polymerase sigma factor SigJ [Solirubrobacteraceae bacterium]|jgi:RNA polymerase sigma-70 factor (ECF subfamily)|nr:RNA polymerase sigma factor SigJ [Solirubrobacteraceae bacterium]
MTDQEQLSEEFERHRPYLRAVAYRMLGSTSEAEDAVQESWLRLSRSDADAVANLRAWLTTVVGRVCVDMLRVRRWRREEYVDGALPEPAVQAVADDDPEAEALLADSVGLALLVVLETLTPAERLAFVLHDMFDVTFDEIAPALGRTPAATRKLASRARRRVRRASHEQDADPSLQRRIIDAFLAASRAGDLDALVAVLDPDVVFRVDLGPAAPGRAPVTGAGAVARQILARGRPLAPLGRPAIVNGAPGVLVLSHGTPLAAVAFTVSNERIVEIDVVADPAKLRNLHG